MAEAETESESKWKIESSHLEDFKIEDSWLKKVSFEATHRNDILDGDDLGDTGGLYATIKVETKWLDLEVWSHFNLYSIEIGETAFDERLQFVRSHMTLGANLKYWMTSEKQSRETKSRTYARLSFQATEVSYAPDDIAAKAQVFLHNHVFSRATRVLNLHYGKDGERTFVVGAGFGGNSPLLPLLEDNLRLIWDLGIQTEIEKPSNSAFTTEVRVQLATAKVAEGEVPLISLKAGFDHLTALNGMNLNAVAEAQLAVQTSDSVYMTIGFGVVLPITVGAYDAFDANPEPLALISVGWDIGPGS